MGDTQTFINSVLDEKWTKTPDMGEYLDNDDIEDMAKQLSEGKDGGAYFLESPYSTELGYHEADNVFVIQAKVTDVVDADTVKIQYDSIQDGGKPFVFLADGKEYKDVKTYLYNTLDLTNTNSTFEVRILGINAPEVPHCRVTCTNKDAKIVYVNYGDLMNNSSVDLYSKPEKSLFKYATVEKDKISFINYKTKAFKKDDNYDSVDTDYLDERKDTDFIKLLEISVQDKGNAYAEILDIDVPDSSSGLPRYAICFLYSPGDNDKNVQYHKDGTDARNSLQKLCNDNVDQTIFVLDCTTFKQQKDNIPEEYRPDSIRLSDDPTYAAEFFYNEITGKEKSYTRIGYNYFGQDYNKRALGAMYIQKNYSTDEKNYGEVWINAAKYLYFTYKDNKTFEILPAYSSSPTNESAFNYNSNAFKMWSYDPDAQCYIDSFNDFHSKYGGDDRADIQKKLTGSDIDQLKEYTVLIGDCLLMVPPTSIRLVSQTSSQRTSLIRAKGAITKSIPKAERILEMQLYFNGDAAINGVVYEQETPSGQTMKYYMNGLRALIAQFKFCPYLPIDNKYINQVLNIEAVSLSSIQINTVPGFPRTLQATIRLTDFEYRQFMPEILPPNIDNKEDLTTNLFAQTIHFPVMRYYYQRAIQNGEAAILLDYNSDEYIDATLGQKTVLQPMKFKSPLIDFYVANENFLKQRKQLKEALEKKPFETVVTYTDKEKDFLKEVAKMYSSVQVILNNVKDLATAINNEPEVRYESATSDAVLDTPFSDIKDSKGYNGLVSKSKNIKEIYDQYLAPLYDAFEKNWDENTKNFDKSIVEVHNIVLRQSLVNGTKDVKIMLALKIVIDWDKGSSDLARKVRQDYGKSFQCSTDKLLVDDAFTVGFYGEFVQTGTTIVKDEQSQPFQSVRIESKPSTIDYTNADIDLLSKLANDFSLITDGKGNTDNNDISGDDLFSQNQELAKIKDNMDLETSQSMKFDPYPIQNCIIESVSVVYNNNFNKMSLNSMHGYVSQYIGASDTSIEINIKTRDEAAITQLQALPRLCVDRLINYRKVMTCSPIRIDCEVARFAGINEVIIESVDINTVPGYPGLYMVSLRLTSVDRTLRNREALKKLDDINNATINNDSNLMTKNFFDLKAVLARVELYPDLELPLISDLEKLGYYFIRYKNQKDRIFPDADFYFVYLHAYTAQMIRKSVYNFFNNDSNMKLEHQISGDLFREDKDININLAAEAGVNPITVTDDQAKKDEQTPSPYDVQIQNVYKQADEAFKNTTYYASNADKSKLNETEKANINKQEIMIDLNESLAASQYSTYDFNHKIKLSAKGNIPFNLADNDQFGANTNLVYEDGTKDYKWRDDSISETNLSVKHLIKNILKKPISTSSSSSNDTLPKEMYDLVHYLIKDVLLCDDLNYSIDIQSGKVTTGKKTSYNQATENDNKAAITNDLIDFIGNKLRVAIASGMTGKNSVLDYDKADKIKHHDDWMGRSEIISPDTGDKVKNILKTVKGQDFSQYVLADKDASIDDLINDGIVFGPYAIKKYDIKYLGTFFNTPKTFGKPGFLDPYYNKELSKIFFDEEISDDEEKSRLTEYIKGITDETWDTAEYVSTFSYATVAMYRILLVWFYRLLDDKNQSFLPTSFFYLNHATQALNSFENNQNLQEKENDFLTSKYNPGYWLAKGTAYVGEGISSIFGGDVKRQTEIAKEDQAEQERTASQLKEMQDNLKSGLPVAKINLVCGLFTALGALAVGEFNTPIFASLSGGNLDDFVTYTEQIKGSYLNADKLSEIDLKMRRFLSYLDFEEFNNKNAWGKQVDPLKKYSPASMIQRKYLKAAEIPRIYLLHSFYDMVISDMRGRMARAFPTYYMLLIDEGRELGMWHLQDNFYDVSSISEFQVVKSRKIAADTASIVMTNLFGTFTSEDEDMKDEYQYTFKDAWNSIFSPRPYFAKEYQRRRDARDFNRAKLKPGARVHLRMGYEGDASRLPIIFNGAVAEVQTQDDMINVICQGDGVELANPDMFNAADADDVADLKYTESMLGGLYGLFNQQTSPRDILINPLMSSGTWIKALIKDWSDSRFFNDNPFGIVHFGDKYYKKIFSNNGEVEQNIFEGINKPSWVASRSEDSCFNEDLWSLETAPKIKVGLEGHKSYWDLMNIAASVAPEFIAAVAPFQLRSTIFYGAPRYYYAYDYTKTTDGSVVEKRKPFQQYHVYTSYSDIIGNKIAASDKDIRTCAVGIYQSDGWLSQTTDSVGPMWLDIDIYPENQKMTTVNCNFSHRSFDLPFTIPIVGKATELFKEDAYKVAWRATANTLKNTVKDMYTGELIVIGDPSVKPYDKMFIYDTYQDMQGTCDIEAVVHTFSVDTGFTTSISPDCVVAVDDKYEKVVHSAMKEIIVPPLVSATTVIALSQRFSNITRSMFFTAAQSVKNGVQFSENIVNSIKTVAGTEELSQYSGIADKVLGTLAPAFDATATDLSIYSSINSLEKAFKNLPSTHKFTNASDLKSFFNDILKETDAINSLDPTELKSQLEKAKEETSKLANINITKGGGDATNKFNTAINNADEYLKAYASAKSKIGNITIDSDTIKAILDTADKLPDETKEGIKDSIEYLEKIKENPLTAGSKGFEEAITNLANVSSKIDKIEEGSDLLKALNKLDGQVFGDTAKALEKFANVGEAFKDINSIKKGAGAIKSMMASNLLWLAAQVVLTKYVQEYLERKLKNLQVLTVFPIMKNNLVMTAGLMGNKGSVFDSPTYNEPGFIEEMAINFFDGKYGSVLPFIADCLVNTSDMREIVNNYKRDSAYGQSGSDDVLRDVYSNGLLTSVTKDDVKGIDAYKAIFMNPRLADPKSEQGKIVFKEKSFTDIADPENYADIDKNLVYIFDDDYLKKFNDSGDKDRSVLLFAAQKEAETTDSDGNKISTTTLNIKSGTEGTGKDTQITCKKIDRGEGKLPIYDIPMLRKDARTVLKRIVEDTIKEIQPDAESDNSTLSNLHEHNIIIHNCTRINEVSWFSTGYSFTIQVKDYSNFGNIIENICKDQPIMTDSNGNTYKAINYKSSDMGDNTYTVMLSPQV
jgi:hypothetical protein